METVTPNRVRPLSLDDLGIVAKGSDGDAAQDEETIAALPDTDEVLIRVRAALKLGFAGAILSGPPGPGKSWYAKRVAFAIADEPDAVRIVQFHTSYQYDDFMEGFSPHEGGGFELQKKTFVLLCDDAAERPDVQHVLLIDEISRCDVARVFGEALTYIEIDKRGQEFTLASGGTLRVPPNLIILATMNPWDKGVDELDVALERRFAHIEMPPSSGELRKILKENGAAADVIERVVGFFESVQKLDDEMVHLGHAYFINCLDEASAHLCWDFRLLPFFKKACRLDRSMLDNITRLWTKAFPLNVSGAPGQTVQTGGDPEGEAGAVQSPDKPT